MRWLILLLLAIGAQAQDLTYRAEVWGPHGVEQAWGNAVLVAPGVALTVAHCVRQPELDIRNPEVEGQPAKVLACDGELALLKVGARGPVARIGTRPPQPEDESTHVWRDRWGNPQSRVVHWGHDQNIVEGYTKGMSGSGLYVDGKLVGMAEKVPGFSWNVFDIAGFLDEHKVLNWSLAEHSALVFEMLGVKSP